MSIRDRKVTALKEISTAFEQYRGRQPKIITHLLLLKQADQITAQEYNHLVNALEDYKQGLFQSLAGSERVRINFDPTAQKQYPMHNLGNYLDPIDLDNSILNIELE